MTQTPLLRALLALAASAVLVAGCGGGGGGGGGEAPAIRSTTPLGPSARYAGVCTPEGQKNFVRSYLDEVYLWFDEIPDVDASRYNNPRDYFNALLVRTPDANGLPRDRFSAALPLAQARDVLQSLDMPQADAQVLKSHTDAVPVAAVVSSPGSRQVGYIQFNDHKVGAQDDLITAFRQIEAQHVHDLVLDLRDNSGGFLYIALTAASMITGPAADGKVFEHLEYNDKRGAESDASTWRFSGEVQSAESQYPAGTPLPRLGLQRVFVLTTGRTCSASESIINSLRGIDVQVIRVGSTTCGKPFGFQQKNNCGVAYFPIEFQGRNAKGFGDYTAGFQPMCEVSEAPGVIPGSTNDPLLTAALHYVDNNACPAGTATGVQSAKEPIVTGGAPPRRPGWAGRLLLPQQQAR